MPTEIREEASMTNKKSKSRARAAAFVLTLSMVFTSLFTAVGMPELDQLTHKEAWGVERAYAAITTIPAADAGITVDMSDPARPRIFASGTAITISAGAVGTDTTSIYVGDKAVELDSSITGSAIDGYDLSKFWIFGGTKGQSATINTSITMTGGMVTNLYGGSEQIDGSYITQTGTTSITMTGGKVSGAVCGGGYGMVSVRGATTINVSDSTVENIFGSGNGAQMKGDSSITVQNSTVTEKIYGGGFNVNADVTGSTSVKVENCTIGSIYGGASASVVTSNTSVTVSNSTVASIYGGGKAGNVQGNTSVTVNSGTVDSIYGGGDTGNVQGNTSVIVNGGTVTASINGGSAGSGNVQGNAGVIVKGVTGKSWIYGGCKGAGVVSSASITLNGGMVGMIYGGGGVGAVSSASITVNGGIVENGLKKGAATTISAVTISGGNVFGNGTGAVPTNGSQAVYMAYFSEPTGNKGGVFTVTSPSGYNLASSSAIRDSYTGENRWYVWLPEGPATATYTKDNATTKYAVTVTTSVSNRFTQALDPLTGSLSISGDAVWDSVLTATVSGVNAGAGVLKYQWKADGSPISGAAAATYQTKLGDIGKVITCEVTATGFSGSLINSGITVTHRMVTGAALNLTTAVPAPAKGGTPVTTDIDNTGYTGTASWSPRPNSSFAGGTAYTAVVTLTSQPGYTFNGLGANCFTHASASSITNDADSGIVTIVFPATPARALNKIEITSQPTKMTYTYGDSFDKSGMVVTATYDDGNKEAVTGYTTSMEGKNFEMSHNGQPITVTYLDKTAQTGSITVNKAAYGGTKTVAANVLTSGITGATVTLPTLPEGASYGAPRAGSGITLTNLAIDSSTLTFDASSSAAGSSCTITVPVTGATNYTDYDITVTVTSSDKQSQTISFGNSNVSKTYGDGAFTVSANHTVGDGTVTYASDDADVATVDGTTGLVTIVGVGDTSATITATAEETATYAQATATYTVTVNKASVSVKADDQTMTVGGALPTFTISYTGFVNNDNAANDALATPAAASCTATGGILGEFDITIATQAALNAAAEKNYTILSQTKGKLTVKAAPSPDTGGTGGGGGGDSSRRDPSNNVQVDASIEGDTATGQVTAADVKKADTITIKSGLGEITFDSKATDSIQSQVGDNSLTAIVTKLDPKTLNQDVKKQVGDNPVYDFSIKAGDKSITGFGGGKVTITLPYELLEGQKENFINAYYVDEDGKLFLMSNIRYNGKNKTVTFTATHFSMYMVAYEEETAQPTGPAFTDVIEGSWYWEAVNNAVSKGLFAGTGERTFGPNEPMTRGMLAVVLHKQAGAPTESTPGGFTDVKAGSWYADAVNWAVSQGIAKGFPGASTGAPYFAPDQSLTREQLITMLHNFAKSQGKSVTGTGTGSGYGTYTDAKAVSSWAAESMTWAVNEKLISGKSGNRLDPKGQATRAEAAAILMKYLAE